MFIDYNSLYTVYKEQQQDLQNYGELQRIINESERNSDTVKKRSLWKYLTSAQENLMQYFSSEKIMTKPCHQGCE